MGDEAGLHIYVAPWQPFTRYVLADHVFRHRANDTRFRCHECLDRRAAKNLEVQAYYDDLRVRCKDGKHPGWS